MNFERLKCLYKYREVYHDANIICCFGFEGDGFQLDGDCNNSKDSYSNLGNSGIFELPKGIQPYTKEA